MNRVDLADCPFMPWKNGAGRTRELLAWPQANDWIVRVSVAEIEADGPFSAFAGIDRCFAVLEGAGVVLTLGGIEHRLTAASDALAFAGELAPICRLVAGPTRDLNLMVRRGAGRASMHRGVGSEVPSRWRGVYAGGTLWWSDDPAEALPDLSDAWTLSA